MRGRVQHIAFGELTQCPAMGKRGIFFLTRQGTVAQAVLTRFGWRVHEQTPINLPLVHDVQGST